MHETQYTLEPNSKNGIFDMMTDKAGLVRIGFQQPIQP